jgi:YbgC/YbaW family acyl-CoA thioester hydrolase
LLCTDRFLVTMADVDAAGIIYFASPLRWAEKLYTCWLHGLGHTHTQMFAAGIATPAVNVTVDYRSHVSVDDELRLELTAARIGVTSFALRLQVFVERHGDAPPPSDGVLTGRPEAVEVRTTHVFCRYTHPSYDHDARTVKQPLPEWLRNALEAGYRERAAPRRQQLT